MNLPFPTPNPVFRREMTGYLRSPWMRVAIGAYLVIPYLALTSQWPEGESETKVFYGGSNITNNVIVSFFISQFLLTSLVLPIMGAFSIAREKENRTLDFLYTTRVRPVSIASAKLGAMLAMGVILLLCSCAGLSFVFYLGGTDLEPFQGMACVLSLQALLACTGSLLLSTVFRNGLAALLASVLALAAMDYLVFRVGNVLNDAGYAAAVGHAEASAQAETSAFLVAWGFSITLGAISLVRLGTAPAEPARKRETPVEDAAALRARRRRWPYYIVDPSRRSDPVADGANPLVAKELRTNPLFRSGWRWRGFYLGLAVILLGFLYFTDHYFQPEMLALRAPLEGVAVMRNMLLTWELALGIAAVWTAVVHSVAFAGEQEAGTIAMLKLTRLSAWDFVRGKWIICWRMRWPFAAIATGTVAVGAMSVPIPEGGDPLVLRGGVFLAGAATTLLLLEVAAITATAVAVHCRSVRNALVAVAVSAGFAGAVIGVPFFTEQKFYSRTFVEWFFSDFLWIINVGWVLPYWALLCAAAIASRIGRLWYGDDE